MPKPKYRKPPDKEHKEKLEAFSFADAWRKKSFQSQHSPMGTRAPSRRASFLSIGKKSITRSKSDATRSDSVKSGGTEKSGVRQREGLGAAKATRLSTEIEAEGDDDPTNGELVSMSRRTIGGSC